MDSAAIEVAIGLFFIYVLLSLVAAQVNNIVKYLLKQKSRTYRNQLQELLGDNELRQQFMAHPLVYITKESGDGAKALTDKPILTAESLKTALIDILVEDSANYKTLLKDVDADVVLALLKNVQEPRLKRLLETLLTTEQTLKDVEAKILTWADGVLERLGQAYKRKMQMFSFITGLVMVLTLNVDTIHLGTTLWNDPLLRQSIAQTASTYAAEAVDPGQAGEEVDLAAAQEAIDTLLDARLPIGWEWTAQDITNDNSRNVWNYFPANNPDNWGGLLLSKLAGLLISAIAVAQGAPFWFDMLRRLTGKGDGGGSTTITVNADGGGDEEENGAVG